MKTNKKVWMILAIYIATFMTAIEATIVVTAANAITTSLGSKQSIALIFSTYLFSSAVATLVLSRFADKYGKKKVFQLGLILFLIGTTLCGVSMNYTFLLIARVVQGIGAGGIMPMTFALIGELFDLKTRGKVMGLNNSAWGIASLVAPLLGGFLVSVLSWHWVFFVNIPLTIFVLLIVQFFYREQLVIENKSEKLRNELFQHSYMIFGLFILLSSIQLLSYQLLLGSIVFLLAIFIVTLFYKLEKHHKNPIIPIVTLRNNKFQLFVLLTFLINGALMGFQVYLPLWIQTELLLSPTLAGLALLPSSILFILGSYFSSQLVIKWGQYKLLLFCLTLSLFGFLILGFLPGNTSYLFLLVLSSILGFSLGTSITTSVITAQSSATNKNLSTVSGFITLCRTLGQSFLITILGIINRYLSDEGTGVLKGYHGVFLFSSQLFLLLFVIVWYFFRRERYQN